ncbi:ABC transporter ATP-binding protein [Actinoplanes friuliensis]|uniref:Spermidine/putrescine import ATP-binding protein potA n=1 Tax=Actinoplanes friuliensis DSM 7358 TaxID=1246995 RepID=U5WBV2_9ACTN|nr:ATP-binding cassette domain-containing protein [Actinoplanes friuliensis]AGZ45480.1 spermidine/putrescine import ATP-binding protein potA [Actinoplanes friuliensis DSM 7358]
MPVLTAAGAGVRHRRRWLFRDLDLSVDPGEIVAVVGPPGSGRTTVLLALSRRFKLSAGRVTGSAALGYVPEVTAPEPVLTVREHVRERLLLLGRSPREASEVPLLGLDPARKGFQLSPYERQVLGLVLATLEKPQVVALDGVDEGLDRRESELLWELIAGLAADGVAVVVTAREIDAERVTTVVSLGGAEPETAPDVDSDQDVADEPDHNDGPEVVADPAGTKSDVDDVVGGEKS